MQGKKAPIQTQPLLLNFCSVPQQISQLLQCSHLTAWAAFPSNSEAGWRFFSSAKTHSQFVPFLFFFFFFLFFTSVLSFWLRCCVLPPPLQMGIPVLGFAAHRSEACSLPRGPRKKAPGTPRGYVEPHSPLPVLWLITRDKGGSHRWSCGHLWFSQRAGSDKLCSGKGEQLRNTGSKVGGLQKGHADGQHIL